MTHRARIRFIHLAPKLLTPNSKRKGNFSEAVFVLQSTHSITSFEGGGGWMIWPPHRLNSFVFPVDMNHQGRAAHLMNRTNILQGRIFEILMPTNPKGLARQGQIEYLFS